MNVTKKCIDIPEVATTKVNDNKVNTNITYHESQCVTNRQRQILVNLQ